MERMDVLGHGSAFGFQNMKSTAELVFDRRKNKGDYRECIVQ
jgi:hypothetical protein